MIVFDSNGRPIGGPSGQLDERATGSQAASKDWRVGRKNTFLLVVSIIMAIGGIASWVLVMVLLDEADNRLTSIGQVYVTVAFLAGLFQVVVALLGIAWSLNSSHHKVLVGLATALMILSIVSAVMLLIVGGAGQLLTGIRGLILPVLFSTAVSKQSH
ncbi:MAG: hypothetical protein LBV30_00795 [Propionibacteriaceae bacterium]|nr:hypothetical protein [Propionibacteriaceae bacterium]